MIRLRIIFTLYFVCIYSIALISQSLPNNEESFKYDLTVSYGKKHYKGKQDCSAIANVIFEPTAIRFEISVNDDHLRFTEDQIHSDHVELWFAVPEVAQKDVAYIMVPDSTLWLAYGKANLSEFKKEAADPIVSVDMLGKEARLHQLDTMDDGGVKDDVKFELEWYKLNQGEPKKVNVPYGYTHFGFLPKNKKVYQYDKELLRFVEKGTQAKLADLSHRIEYKSKVRKDGYDLTIRIPMNALAFYSGGFARNPIFMIDVIDSDNGVKSEKVLSSSIERKWARAETFNSVVLRSSCWDSTLLKILPPKDILDTRDKIFMQTMKGWHPVELNIQCITNPHRLRPHELPNLYKVRFITERFGFTNENINGKELRVYTTQDSYSAVGRKDIIVFEEGKSMEVDQYVGAFVFPSGRIGIVACDYEFEMGGCFASGMCGCNINAYLYITYLKPLKRSEFAEDQTNPDDKLPIANWSGCGYYTQFGDSLKFEDHEYEVNICDAIHDEGIVDYGNVFDWASILSWKAPGKTLIIDLGRGIKIKAEIDEKSWRVNYTRL